jgi:LPXTG-motif cell wall-anchored protein
VKQVPQVQQQAPVVNLTTGSTLPHTGAPVEQLAIAGLGLGGLGALLMKRRIRRPAHRINR